MFKISKSKGKPYKTDDPAQADKAYKGSNKSMSMYYNGDVVKTKTGKNGSAYSQQGVWKKLQNNVKGGTK